MSKPNRWSRLFSKKSSPSRRQSVCQRRERLRCELLESRRVMAVFAVDTIEDSVAVDLLTGQDANGTISIRSAIMAANSQAGSHIINIPDSAPSYRLTLFGSGENFSASGDLDVRSTIEINASANTILEAQNVDRIFEVQGNGNLTLNGLHLMGGIASQGGAILNRGTLTVNNSTVDGSAGELVLAVGVTIDTTPKNAWGGAIFNAASGQVNLNRSFVHGSARGSTGFGSPDGPGVRGGHAYGGAIYNLGSFSSFGSQIFGDATGGTGADGFRGNDGIDSVDGQLATNGQPGFAGGAGGYAYGGVIYNGPVATIDLAQTIVDGNAWGGFGGRGGNGGNGGAASALNNIAAGQAGAGGIGGPGGLAYGGGIYNAGGSVSFASGDFGNSFVRANANGGAGGQGGTGGVGGNGDIDLATEQNASGSNGGAGGVGGLGGVAYGGGIYTLIGNINIVQADISGLIAEQTLGAYGGAGGIGGAGGAGAAVFASVGSGNGGAGARGGRGGTAEGGGLYIKNGSVEMQGANIDTYQTRGGDAGASGQGGLASLGLHGITSTGATGAAAQGGAVSVRGGQLNFSNGRIYSNGAFGGQGGMSGDGLAAGMGGLAQGGGIFVGAGILNVIAAVVDSNNAVGGSGGFADVSQVGVVGTDGGLGGNAQGGGLAGTGGLVVFENSTFVNNSVTGGDGSDGSVGNLFNLFDPEQVGGDGGRGGAAAGGGLYTTGGDFFLRNSTLHGNRATGGLGGKGGPAWIVEGSEVGPFGLSGGNSSGRGGGSFHTGSGLLSLDSVTVARNEIGDTLGSGAGLYNVGGTVQVHNTLIALNKLAIGNLSNNWDAVGAFSSQGYNIISVRNGTTGFTATGDRRGLSTAPLDVKLGPLSFNGLPTAAPLFSSIAINAGDPLVSLPRDQLGNFRFGRADIGAVEFIPIQQN